MKTLFMMKTPERFVRALTAISVLLAFFANPAFAKTYAEPAGNNSLLGEVEYTTSSAGETLVSIAQRFNLGVNQITDANPGIIANAILPSGVPLQIPASFLLPALPRRGIVINLAEMRMYYYPKDGVVMTYPVGIGKVGKTIPIRNTSVVRKAENPIWIPPDDIREYNEKEQGIILPKIMQAGPDNPLGPYAIYLQIPTFLIHSTIFPDSVGRRASFGCIRMHETDIKDFYPLVKTGTSVAIVDMPNKVGWAGNRLYLESHPPLEEHSTEPQANMPGIVSALEKASGDKLILVDWQLVNYVAEQRDGIPREVGFVVSS